jgi:dGTP triphosphohydrolase
MLSTQDPKKGMEKEKVSSQSNDDKNSLKIQQERQEQEEKAINRVLDDTKENIRKTISEARKEIPSYTKAVNDSQEQTIEAIQDIAYNYIDSQKDIINSFQQSTWVSQIGNAYQSFWSNWMLSPKRMKEIYANMVSHSVDNTFTATRLANNMISGNMEAFKTSMQQTKNNAKELLIIGINTTKAFEQISRNMITRGSQ